MTFDIKSFRMVSLKIPGPRTPEQEKAMEERRARLKKS